MGRILLPSRTCASTPTTRSKYPPSPDVQSPRLASPCHQLSFSLCLPSAVPHPLLHCNRIFPPPRPRPSPLITRPRLDVTLRASRERGGRPSHRRLTNHLPSWTNSNITAPTCQELPSGPQNEISTAYFPAGLRRSIVPPRLDYAHCNLSVFPRRHPRSPHCGIPSFVIDRRECGPIKVSRADSCAAYSHRPINSRVDPCLPLPSQLRPPPTSKDAMSGQEGRYPRRQRVDACAGLTTMLGR